MRNKERTSHQRGWHNVGSGTQGAEEVVPQNSRMTLQKREAANIEGAFSNRRS